eukprot:9520703-Lingulodinium_polyedra.AAC.1
MVKAAEAQAERSSCGTVVEARSSGPVFCAGWRVGRAGRRGGRRRSGGPSARECGAGVCS